MAISVPGAKTSRMKQRREHFCLELAKGTPVVDAYIAAGFPPNDQTARTMARSARVQARVGQLRQVMEDKIKARPDIFDPAQADSAWLMQQLYTQVLLGREMGDLHAGNKALEIIAKMIGSIQKGAGRPTKLAGELADAHVARINRREAEDIPQIDRFIDRMDDALGDDGADGEETDK